MKYKIKITIKEIKFTMRAVIRLTKIIINDIYKGYNKRLTIKLGFNKIKSITKDQTNYIKYMLKNN